MSNDEQFERRLRETLNRQSLDRRTRDALQAARVAALDGRRSGGPRRWIPATAAAVVLLVVGAWLYPQLREPGLPRLEVDDLVVITDEDELELFEELEFYVWFEQEQPV